MYLKKLLYKFIINFLAFVGALGLASVSDWRWKLVMTLNLFELGFVAVLALSLAVYRVSQER